jgi:hypothetical protein
MTDARTRDHDRVILKILLQGRETVPIGHYTVERREGAIICAFIDIFIRKILEGKCANQNRNE